MSHGALIDLEVSVGDDPTARLVEAWERGERVRLVSKGIAAKSDVVHALALPRGAFDRLRCAPSAGVVIATSGSSGSPRFIDIGLEAMLASATLGARVIPFGAGDVWHSSLAPAHIGGVMIFVRALVLGGAVRVGAQPRRWSDLEGVTHVSLVGAQLARLLEDEASAPRSLKAVMLGGGPSGQALRDAAILRGIPLFSSYGLTETSSQVATGALRIGDAATLAGPPIEGIGIAIDPVSGEILVDGPTLARGEFVDGQWVELSRPLRTRDTGFLDESGRLHIIGRLDSMFISGGRNIHPEQIERALAALAGVRSACVVGVAHEKWGRRPVAFIDVAAGSAEKSLRSVREQLRATLEPHLVPDAIYRMPIDEAAGMKPSRARLSSRLASGERFDAMD